MKKLLTLLGAFLLLSSHLFAQGTVTGKVTDSKTGTPLSGISVKIQGTNLGTSTSADGSFSLTVADSAIVTLEFSGIGFGFKTMKATAGQDIVVDMVQENKSLTEVVVTAIGITREKRQLTYSTQTVKGDDIVAAHQDNIVNGLAGKVSGVQITNSTGMPGSSARIVIRGATSLNGENQPLFIVDGVPIDNSEPGPVDPFNSGQANASLNEGSSSNRAIDIDPNIIESVTVLKGAAATALYGSAAARGAIIITTKKGLKAAHPQVTFSSSYAFLTPILAKFQDKYAQGDAGIFFNPDSSQFISTSWGPAIDTLTIGGKPAPKYDPRKLFFRTGHTTDNNLTVSGATDKSNYLVSYSYLRTDGITPNTSFTRNSFFSKFSNQVTSKVTANIQFNYINSVNNRIEEGNGLQNPLWTVYAAPISWNPFPYLNPDGSQRVYRAGRNNPYYLLNNTGFTSNVNRILPVASLVYAPLKWLSITDRVAADIYSDQSNYFESNGVINGLFDNNGGITNRVENFRQYNNDLFLDARKELVPNLTSNLILGTNLQTQTNEVTTQTGEGQTIPKFYNIGSMSTITAADVLTRYRKVGFYAQANFEYRRMLDLALTGRYDGSSVLNVQQNFYPYGSAALGFVFTELMKPSTILNFGKVRVSYASVGNDNLVPYSLTTPYVSANGFSNNISFPFNGQSAYLQSNSLGNSSLTNEKLNEFEVGLELKFFNNRLYFEGSYFDRQTSELLTSVPAPPSSGYFTTEQNSGSMEDKGVELLLSGTPVKTKDFAWDISATFTKINNKVKKLAPGVDNIQFGGFGGGGGIYAFPGKPYGVIYGTRYLRNAAGEIEMDDNGLPLEAPTNGIIGSTQADFNTNLSNTFTYKNFALYFVIDWKQGGDIYNLDNHYNLFYGTPKATENRDNPIVVKGVNATTGAPNTVPITAEAYYQQISDIDEAVVENGTYVKLRTAGISYTLTDATLTKLPFKSITITFSGNNLFIYKPYFTGSDPEASLSGSGNGQGVFNYLTPTSRSFLIGLRAAF